MTQNQDLLEKILKKIEALEADIKEIKKNQELTHLNQEKTHKNQVDMENKLDAIRAFESQELEELKDLEEADERELINDRFGKVTGTFHQTVIDNLTEKMAKDEWLTPQLRKIIEYLFSNEKYNPSRKKFEGANFSEVSQRAHVNRSVVKDLLLKLEEENYIVHEVTSQVDPTRKLYRANVNFFKN